MFVFFSSCHERVHCLSRIVAVSMKKFTHFSIFSSSHEIQFNHCLVLNLEIKELLFKFCKYDVQELHLVNFFIMKQKLKLKKWVCLMKERWGGWIGF